MVIAHEIGHAFQYLIYCRQLAEGIEDSSERGFRYGYPGSNGGNALWEICAQWQSWKDYPEEYVCHGWDDTEENDVQMPYALKMDVH